MTGLTISRTDIGADWVSLDVAGEIDLATVDQLEKDIRSFLDTESGNLAVNLSGADFMDSTGLRCLVMADRSFREADRRFALVVASGPISRLIDLSGVDSTIHIVGSVGELAAS